MKILKSSSSSSSSQRPNHLQKKIHFPFSFHITRTRMQMSVTTKINPFLQHSHTRSRLAFIHLISHLSFGAHIKVKEISKFFAPCFSFCCSRGVCVGGVGGMKFEPTPREDDFIRKEERKVRLNSRKNARFFSVPLNLFYPKDSSPRATFIKGMDGWHAMPLPLLPLPLMMLLRNESKWEEGVNATAAVAVFVCAYKIIAQRWGWGARVLAFAYLNNLEMEVKFFVRFFVSERDWKWILKWGGKLNEWKNGKRNFFGVCVLVCWSEACGGGRMKL
jgi:hypothetical protein